MEIKPGMNGKSTFQILVRGLEVSWDSPNFR